MVEWRALEVPTRQIAENWGLNRGVVVDPDANLQRITGLYAGTGKYVDLIEAGIHGCHQSRPRSA